MKSGIDEACSRISLYQTRRYISPDPIGLAGGLNIYGYVEQNPLSLIDPTGEAPPIIAGIITATIATCRAAISAIPKLISKYISKDVVPTTKQLEKFKKQLRELGAKSLERSQRKIERRLNEHLDKLNQIKKEGGHTSSVEREIRNFERELGAIKQTLGDN